MLRGLVALGAFAVVVLGWWFRHREIDKGSVSDNWRAENRGGRHTDENNL
jgi:hypothetical protein